MADTKLEPQPDSTVSPVYIPWKTFGAYVGSLKDTTVPHTLDSTVRPSAMAGGVWRQLTSALQFLGLIDTGKVTRDSFTKLVKAHGTPDWKQAVKLFILSAYSKITDGLPLDRATSGQLEKCFRAHSKLDGQMLDKAVRFYLNALKEAGVPYSSHLEARKDRPPQRKKKVIKDKTGGPDLFGSTGGNGDDETPDDDDKTQTKWKVPTGYIEFPIHLRGGTVRGQIVVPADLTPDEVKMVELVVPMLRAYTEAKRGT